MTAFVPDLLIKLTLLLAAGLAIASLVRGAAASLRHLVLFATLASALALPMVMLLAPRWEVPVLPNTAGVSATHYAPSRSVIEPAGSDLGLESSTQTSGLAQSVSGLSTGDATTRAAGNLAVVNTPWIARVVPALPVVWLLGCVAVFGWLIIGRVRLARIGRSAWPLESVDWQTVLEEERRAAEVTKSVRLCSSPVVSTPLTWGSRQPVVLLPEDAEDWSDEHRRVVLRHELAHIARGDSFAQLVSGIGCALYWFHPLVWAVERRLRAQCERACDDRVVSLGTPAADYAAHLLEVARSARAFGAPGFLSVAMARPSQLEGRLLAVLSESPHRATLSRNGRRAIAALSGLMLLPLAAFRVVPKQPVRMAKPPVRTASLTVRSPEATHVTPSSSPPPVIAPAPRTGIDSTFHLSAPARSGGSLTLDLKTGGAIIVTGWDRSEVSVDARLAGRDWRDTEVQLDPADGGARLESYFRNSSNSQSSNHTFRISVPRKFDLDVKSSGGSIDISGVEGRFSGHTGGGDVEIRNASGEADLRTGGGDIRVSDSHLTGIVSTGGGTVRIERVTGNLSGLSGSGPVSYSSSSSSNDISAVGAVAGAAAGAGAGASAGAASGKRGAYAYSGIRMTSGGGDISVPEAPDGAYVTTGGGKVRIGPSGGQVYAQTGGGQIDIGPASGSVEAVTGAGDVAIRLEGADDHSVRATSGSGDITLDVPANLNAILDLETAYTESFGRKTRIVSDFPLNVTETTAWENIHGTPRRYVRARQIVGRGGNVIRIRTVNGDINLRRR